MDPTFKERLDFSGNNFSFSLEGKDLGKAQSTAVKGWYFCSSQPEVEVGRKFFVVTSVDPEGAFGWSSGYVFNADTMLGTDDGASLLLAWYDGVDTSASADWGGTENQACLNAQCDDASKPATAQPCNVQACPPVVVNTNILVYVGPGGTTWKHSGVLFDNVRGDGWFTVISWCLVLQNCYMKSSPTRGVCLPLPPLLPPLPLADQFWNPGIGGGHTGQ